MATRPLRNGLDRWWKSSDNAIIKGLLEDVSFLISPFKDLGDDIRDAYKAIFGAPTLRENLDWLQRVSRWIDNGLELVPNGTNISIKNGAEEVGEIVNDLLHVRYSGYGGDVVCHSSKTTTVIGKWNDVVDGGGTGKLINSKLTKSGENPAGANVLSFDGTGMTESQQWVVNSQWIDDAVGRGDIIRVISDPTNPANIYKNGDPSQGLSFFGREIGRLENVHGYVWDASLFQYVK